MLTENMGLGVVDIVIAVCYVASMLGIGLYLFKKQKSTKDYMLAGKSMGWLTVGFSLMATLTSAVGYMSFPAAAVKYGIIMLWMILAIPLSYPVVMHVFMPFYHKLNVYTAYEYLEKRFGLSVRLLASAIFIMWRITWMSLVIYVPSLTLNIVSDGAIPLIPSVIFLGILGTINTSLGGVKAVMWGDLIHSIVMFSSMIVAVVVIILAIPGGIPEFWSVLSEANMTRMFAEVEGWSDAGLFGKMELYLFTDITMMALIITYTIQKMGNYCVDQVMVQRYLTATSLKTSQLGFQCNCFAYCFYVLAVTTIGVSLFAVSSHYAFPDTLRNDHIFPYFIANIMPVGMAGLMLAAIYGASMSSLDSGVNSCVTAILNDFYTRGHLKKHNLNDESLTAEQRLAKLKIARISTLILGTMITVLACYVGRMGDIFTIAAKLINMFAGPLFGVFVLGMFTRSANTPAVLVAGLIGAVMGFLTVFADKFGLDHLAVGILWPATIAFTITILLGYGLSMIFNHKNPDVDQWLWKNIVKRDS